LTSTDPLEEFLGTLVPPAPDRAEVSARREQLKGALEKSSLSVEYMFESGSWSHGTGIAGKSDVDYMAWAFGARPERSSSALTVMKRAVEDCDWKINEAHVSSPVVGVTYYTGPHFEVVPAWFKGEVRGHSVYWIPGRRDEWVISAPRAHLEYVNVQNDRLNKKVKPLVRLLKAWKLAVGVPASSFYLEMRTTQYASGESSIFYDLDLRVMFGKLADEEFRDMNDPQGLVGRIPACSTDDKRRLATRLAQAAEKNLWLAADARERGDASAYWSAMYDVFGSEFPYPSWR
jgi:hypothetical protein